MLSWRENSQNSHQKSPKSPFGGILPFCVNETCRESNSVWKIGITSFIRLTQSKIRSIFQRCKSWETLDFESMQLWTGWVKWSLWYQFSRQNLILYNFHLRRMVIFRQLAILAIFGGYFGYFLAGTTSWDFEIKLVSWTDMFESVSSWKVNGKFFSRWLIAQDQGVL